MDNPEGKDILDIAKEAEDNYLMPTESFYRQSFINPHMTIQQYPAFVSPAASGINFKYYIDGWIGRVGGVTAEAQNITNNQPFEFSTSIRMKSLSTASGQVGWRQSLEQWNLLKGKRINISIWVKSNNSNARIWIAYRPGLAIGSAHNHSGSGEWELLTMKYNVPINITWFIVNITTLTYPGLTLAPLITGDYVELTGASMSVGDRIYTNAIRFKSLELLLCQRYKETKTVEIRAYGRANLSEYIMGRSYNFVPKRTNSPTITGSNWIIYEDNSLTNVEASYTKDPQVMKGNNWAMMEVYKTPKAGSRPSCIFVDVDIADEV